MKLLFFFSLFFSLICFGSKGKKLVKSAESSKLQYRKITSSISKLKNDLTRMEGRLGKSSNRYYKVVERKNEIDETLLILRKKLHKLENSLVKNRRKIKKTIQGIVLLEENDVEDSFANQMLLGLLKKDLIKVNSLLGKLTLSKDIVSKLEVRMDEYIKTEYELAILMNELEAKKNIKITNYYNLMDEKAALRAKLKSFKKKVAKSGGSSFSFIAPANKYVKIDYDKKGINFYVKKKQKVLAVADGQVAYAGRLSKYGNIVILDHGNQTRSLVLGDFKISAKKGVFVKKGQSLGLTKDLGKSSKLYFEVRRKDKSLNTIRLMSDKFLAENNLNSKKV